MRILFPLLFALTLAAQTPAFEVASIRLASANAGGGAICGRASGPESLLVSGARTLVGLVAEAYQGVDGLDFPQWIKNGDRFAVNVRIPPNTNTAACREMLRNLLAERFHLVTAIETRDVTRLYLKVAKSGLKLQPADPSAYDPNARISAGPVAGMVHYTYRATPMSRILTAIGTHAVMEARTNGLINNPSYQIAAGSGVIDETGLTGFYNGAFTYYATPVHEEPAESLEDALTRQLGLTLEVRRAPGKVLVIRSGDKMPTEN